MCQFVAERGGSKAECRQRNVQDKKNNLEDLLRKAAHESREAANAIMKRRIRQRLHKKLGCVLSKTDFSMAMQRLKVLEAELETANKDFHSADVPVWNTFIRFKMPAPQTSQRRCRSVG
ncbi:Kinase D-interacting substrate of 220 kDa [Durusdinium trenchii]|uniref:Kinase D-interacting substrate of 220 kDa n=1 Tax=Durusdinium trenchii TaxID=1381693 RepID=A0ABP0JBG8_9DINO